MHSPSCSSRGVAACVLGVSDCIELHVGESLRPVVKMHCRQLSQKESGDIILGVGLQVFSCYLVACVGTFLKVKALSLLSEA